MGAPEDIDPKREDVAAVSRKKRRRAQPPPSPTLQAEKAKARSRAVKRPLSPAIMFEHGKDGYVATAPHSDSSLWELQLADAFGTRSQSVMHSFINDLTGLCSRAWDQPNEAWKPNETELNAILAMVNDHRPRTIGEAALAAQAVAIHILTMRLAKQAFNGGGMVMERDAALTGKLARTYVLQVEALQALKGKRRTTKQSIKVSKELHQHVHYHDDRGAEFSDDQSHAKPAGGAPILSEVQLSDAGRNVVPLASGARKGKVPHARGD